MSQVSQFTGWPLALEFELREVELLFMVLITILLALTLLRPGYSAFHGVSEISQYPLVNFVHFPWVDT